MIKKFQKTRMIIGIFAAVVGIIFGIWLVLLMFGYPLTTTVLSKELSFVDFFRLIAEITIGALMVAALAFL